MWRVTSHECVARPLVCGQQKAKFQFNIDGSSVEIEEEIIERFEDGSLSDS